MFHIEIKEQNRLIIEKISGTKRQLFEDFSDTNHYLYLLRNREKIQITKIRNGRIDITVVLNRLK